MKKLTKFVVIATGLLLLSSLIIWTLSYGIVKDPRKETTKEQVSQPQLEEQKSEYEIKLVFDPENETSFKFAEWKDQTTAFDLLEKAAREMEIEMKTQQYDFGVFVKSIDGYESSEKMAWIYFVNGESANVAADQYELQPKDIVEWKYIKPEF